MKIVLKNEKKNYTLEPKKVSGFIKIRVRELEQKQQELIWQTLKDIDKVGISSISIDELLILKNYQSLYPNQAAPSEVMNELRPIYKKISSYIEDLHSQWFQVEMCKILLDAPKEIEDLFNSNYDSDFWLSQDEEELSKVVEFFRRRRS